jgi:micrococcal nuclease
MRRLAFLVLLAGACAAQGPLARDTPGTVPARVTRVVDGDTLHVELGGRDVTIRLIGIDTPEVEGPFTERACFGQAASRYAHELLDGQEVRLGFDVERLDPFDRTLAYVWLAGELVNERIVADGYAVVATFPPNVKYVDRFLAAEQLAREQGRGLWGRCR